MSECLRDSNGSRLCSSAALPDDLCEDCAGCLAPAIPPHALAFVLANLPAIEQLARVAKLGGQKHGGGYGPGAWQTDLDHLKHATGHADRAWSHGLGSRDHETGELDLAHAATRIVMALGVIGGTK